MLDLAKAMVPKALNQLLTRSTHAHDASRRAVRVRMCTQCKLTFLSVTDTHVRMYACALRE